MNESEIKLRQLKGEDIIIPDKHKRSWNPFKKDKIPEKRLTKEEAEQLSEDSEIPIVQSGKSRSKHKLENLKRKDKRKLAKHPEISFLVEMFFSNGTSKEFVICSKEEVFCYKKRWYFLRYEDSWFNTTQNNYKLNFFDDFPVPISRKVVKVGDKNYWAVSPSNLKPLIDMEYVKALVSSDLDKYIKMCIILVIIVVFMSLINSYYSYKGVKMITEIGKILVSR